MHFFIMNNVMSALSASGSEYCGNTEKTEKSSRKPIWIIIIFMDGKSLCCSYGAFPDMAKFCGWYQVVLDMTYLCLCKFEALTKMPLTWHFKSLFVIPKQ